MDNKNRTTTTNRFEQTTLRMEKENGKPILTVLLSLTLPAFSLFS